LGRQLKTSEASTMLSSMLNCRFANFTDLLLANDDARMNTFK
jgi:hypothetical protein